MLTKKREGLVRLQLCEIIVNRIMEASNKLNRLADTTYRVRWCVFVYVASFALPQNNEELAAELHRLAAAARTYHRAMQGLSGGVVTRERVFFSASRAGSSIASVL